MKQSVVLLIIALAFASCLVLMTELDSDATNPSEPIPDSPEGKTEAQSSEGYSNGHTIWGILGLLSLIAVMVLIVFLEHKGILKDPMLD